MGRTPMRVVAGIALVALFTGASVAGVAAVPDDVAPPTPLDSPNGNYIVLLEEAPVAGYDGGTPGLAPTKPDEGEKLDTQSTAVKRYSAFLKKRQTAVADDTGLTAGATYQVTLNGFSARMTSAEAADVATAKGVLGVFPDEIRHPLATPTDFLGLEGSRGVWAALGGIDQSGAGVVVGVVDTGIAPENPSFDGSDLGPISGAEPYLSGNTIVYDKADGTQFRSARVTGAGWSNVDYSTKIVGAQAFSTGAAAAGFDFASDYRSPRDGDGHGSHTASTAAGRSGVAAGTRLISGVAPSARIAAYKACYVGPNTGSVADDICTLSDLLEAVDAAVADGVDVINYSIGGGGPSTSTFTPEDVAFYNAAVAGVFVAAAAGNSGPTASTAEHAAPWYTTVAASTVPSYSGGTPPSGAAWAPQIASFSSRGPMLADDGDVLKPDITAPGDSILAATSNAPGRPATFGTMSGTSMATPHVAGLAALYLSRTHKPLATPAEIKSALMTTAYDTKAGTGGAMTDPFAQGAGHVQPQRYLDPGLVYLNGSTDWQAFIEGTGEADFGEISPIDPTQLNLASIAIGRLAPSEQVIRTVTATRAGTYTAVASVPGVTVTVQPSTITLAEGESASFTVTFANQSAPVEKWATGFLTWTDTGGAKVRSPLAVRPVAADAPAEVDAEGMTAGVDIAVRAGMTGSLPLRVSGLAPVTLLRTAASPTGHSGDQDSGEVVFPPVTVAKDTALARWSVDSSDDANSDLDLAVYRLVSAGSPYYDQMWEESSTSADEEITLERPTAGTYVVVARVASAVDRITWDLTQAIVGATGSGTLSASPNPMAVTRGAQTTFRLSWKGLPADRRYLGVVRYGDSNVNTIVSVSSGGAAPVALSGPVTTGMPTVGGMLTATAGMWSPSHATVAYQWLRDGQPLSGATSATYPVTSADAGSALAVRVSARASESVNGATATSDALFVTYASRTTVTPDSVTAPATHAFSLAVAVQQTSGAPAAGAVTVWVDDVKYTVNAASGTATVVLPPQSPGTHVIRAEYPGTASIAASRTISGFVVLPLSE